MLEPVRTGSPVHSDEDWFIRRDGSFFPVSYTSVPIDLASGRGVVVTFIDLTAQREAERGLRQRDAILARVDQPVWVVDHEGRFRYANPAALAALGYEHPSELVGRLGHETVHYKYPDGRPYPTEDCPLTRARRVGREHERPRGLARAQGRLDRPDRLLVRAVRPARGAGLGDRVDRHGGAARGRAGRARPRHRRGARRRAARRAPPDHRGGRRRPRARHPRPARRRAAAVRQRGAHAAARRAPGRRRRRRRGSGAPRSSRRARASRTCATSPPASTRGSSPTAGWGPRSRRWPRGCRCRSRSTTGSTGGSRPRSRPASTSS